MNIDKKEIPFTSAKAQSMVLRFCPSPTGHPHIGLMRTALFNFAYARANGAKLIFRIEDTDASRDTQESAFEIINALKWLGLSWDEGVEIGGNSGPYYQSQRHNIYKDIILKLENAGYLYKSFATAQDIESYNKAHGLDIRQGYNNFERGLSEEEVRQKINSGIPYALRFKVPDIDLSFEDCVRGKITIKAGDIKDFVVVRPNGVPLYTLTNPLDDALMGITHIIRGEDLLASTARQIALYLALIDIGITDFVPRFAHLPVVVGENKKKLSKRDKESNFMGYIKEGYIQEGVLNYLSLLGWSYSDKEDIFGIKELIKSFNIEDVVPSPARFDLKKFQAINASHMRLLNDEDYAERLLQFIENEIVGAHEGLDNFDKSCLTLDFIIKLIPYIKERASTLMQAYSISRFLFAKDLDYNNFSAGKINADLAKEILQKSIDIIDNISWSVETIQNAFQTEFIDKMQLKPRDAYPVIRNAISCQSVTPPLFESIYLLGKQKLSLRLKNAVNSL